MIHLAPAHDDSYGVFARQYFGAMVPLLSILQLPRATATTNQTSADAAADASATLPLPPLQMLAILAAAAAAAASHKHCDLRGAAELRLGVFLMLTPPPLPWLLLPFFAAPHEQRDLCGAAELRLGGDRGCERRRRGGQRLAPDAADAREVHVVAVLGRQRSGPVLELGARPAGSQ